MKLYHPTTEQQEAHIRRRGFMDTIIPIANDSAGRLVVRWGVGFANTRNGPDGHCWVEVEIPDEFAVLFEDSDPGADVRYFYVPAALATYYLRKQGE